MIMRQFENLRKMDILKKNQNLKWEFFPKKGSRVIVTSFNQNQTIVKVYFTILNVFKISSFGYNYAAFWKLEKNGHLFLKKIETWNWNIFLKKEAESI